MSDHILYYSESQDNPYPSLDNPEIVPAKPHRKRRKTKAKTPHLKRHCVHCGEVFWARKKTAIFCSGKCRIADWRAVQKANNCSIKEKPKQKKEIVVRACPGCNALIFGPAPNQIYHNDACRMKLYRRTKKAMQKKAPLLKKPA